MINPNNPYQAPPSLTEDIPQQHNYRHIAQAHQWIIGAVLLFILSVLMTQIIWKMLLGLLALFLSLAGATRLVDIFVHTTLLKAILIFGLFIPIFNILILLFLSHKTTKILRQAGYAVGLLGARL